MDACNQSVKIISSTQRKLAQEGIILDENLFNSIREKFRPKVLSAPFQPQQDFIKVDDESDLEVLESTPITSGASSTLISPSKVGNSSVSLNLNLMS